MPQELQWTMGAAPEVDEPAPDQPPPSPARPVNPRVWPLTIVLIVVVLAGLGAFTIWNSQKVPRDLRQVITAEETAGRTGDVDTLGSIADPHDAAWRRTLLQLATAHQAAPLPYAALRPVPGAADTIAFTTLAPDEVRADVTRAYLAPDGATLDFTLPQFYRFSQKQWHRIAPPTAGAAFEFWRGHYVSIAGRTADADFVANDLGPYLDDVVQRACEVWTCPRGPFIGVGFADDFSFTSWPGSPPAPVAAPLLFGFIRAANPRPSYTGPNLLASALNIQSPHMAGYPADAASAAWLRGAIAMQTLNTLANHIAHPNPANQNANAFLLALVVRMGARLGLEAPSALDWHSAAAGAQPANSALSTDLNLMWNLGQQDYHGQPVLGYRDSQGNQFGPDNPDAWDTVLNGALDLTNWVLRDQPPETDGNLLRSLASAPDQSTWLANALGITQEAAWARLQLAQWQMNRPVGQPELALDCNYGAGLVAPGQTGPIYFLPWQLDTFASAQGLSFSPDGQWLIGDNSNAIVAVNVETGSVVQLAPPPNDNIAFRGWLTSSVIAYVLQHNESGERGGPIDYSLHFFDVSQPQRSIPSLPGIQDYNLSPDKTRAAVVVAHDTNGLSQLVAQVIPALGGPATTIDDVLYPALPDSLVAWSPDSRLLAYAHQDVFRGKFSLRVMDPTRSGSQEVLNNQEIGLEGSLHGYVAWSPDGRQIAFGLSQEAQSSAGPSAFGLANVDGTGLTLLRQQNGFYTQLGWSADGKYLAATNYTSNSQSTQTGTILVIDAASKLEVNQLVNSWGFAWSPQGHQLVDVRNPLELFPEPDSPTPQILTTDSCTTAVWQPQP
jgi:WD40-like Beta Propeller Repeat